MKTKQLFFLAFILVFASCKKNNNSKTQNTSALNFEEHFQINHKLNEDELKIEISLDEGFHAYGPGETVGRPISLTVLPDNGWLGLEPFRLPVAKVKIIPGLGKSVVYENSVNISQKISPGPKNGKAILLMQVCTDDLCDRPREHELQLSLPAKNGEN